MLEDEDKRVVQAGANALPVLLMNLCASERYRDGGGLTRSELAYYNVLHWFHSPQEVNGRLEERANGNLLWALPSLLRGTNCQSSRLRTLAVLGGSAPAAGAPSGSGGSGGADDSSLSYGGGYYRAFAELARHNRHQFRAHKRRELLQRPMSRGDVRLNLDAFSKELVFLGLERCINGSISDLDTHCDVLLCCADLFRAVEVPEEGASSSTTAPTPSASKDPIVIAKLWKPVSAHILKILNILATIIRDPEVPRSCTIIFITIIFLSRQVRNVLLSCAKKCTHSSCHCRHRSSCDPTSPTEVLVDSINTCYHTFDYMRDCAARGPTHSRHSTPASLSASG